MFFSIIVPVYNVETYLRECVDSILSQNFSGYELILVNDGSTDSSGSICEEYASSYSNKVNVVHKENGGLSDARNFGIDRASGEYIIFVDSDDYITENSLNIIHEKLSETNNTDILITRLMQIYPDGSEKYMDKDMPTSILNNSSKDAIIEWNYNSSQTIWPATRYIIKKSVIEKNNLAFKKGYLHEDVDWTMKLFLYAEKFQCLKHYWYVHRMERVGSITTKPNVKRVLDVIELVSLNINNPSYNLLNNSSQKVMNSRLVTSLYSSISKYNVFNKEDKQKIEDALKKNSNILKYASKPKHKLLFMVTRVIGIKFGLGLIRFFN
ncbi:glycosyltransferase [Pseudalkalibacillus hwajinpoensis]|uniref:glycosyltransferase family 2 protein n=1 Tax=Guptibacillus hwajinpoensis TaxID=208199 RepID=UPI00325B26F0